jgi:hypothetical protein
LANPEHRPIDLRFLDTRTPLHIFLMCLDLFCRGLVLLFGDVASSSVCLSELSRAHIDTVASNMRAAGIVPSIHIWNEDPDVDDGVLLRHQSTNLMDIVQADPADLTACVLHVRLSNRRLCRLTFRLVHERCGLPRQSCAQTCRLQP